MATLNEYHFELPLRTDAELRLFVEKAWGVRIPDKQICPNHTTPWRAFADAYFARSRIAVWKASRGFGGKSYLLALLGLTEAATLKADVNVLGASGEQSQRVHSHMVQFWNNENAPRQLLDSDPTQIRTKLVWGNSINTLMASQKSVRGPHPQRLRLDEIDEMDIEVLDAAMGEPMTKNGIPAQTVMSSTHQYPNGTMAEILDRAAEKGFPVYEWCMHETSEPHGWLSREEIEAKRIDIPEDMWRVEYELQLPVPPSGYSFDREWWHGQNRYHITNKGLVNRSIGRWMSWDTAEKDKTENAYTACAVFDMLPTYELVLRRIWRDRLQFPDLPDQIRHFAHRYNADNKLRGILIEDKSSGTSALQTLRASSDDMVRELLIGFQPRGDKDQRARQAAVWAKRGMIQHPYPHDDASWLGDFEHELYNFPESRFKDQVDAYVQGILYLEYYLSEGWRAKAA